MRRWPASKRATAWSLRVAATWLDAYFRDGFPLCTGACPVPAVAVAAGTPIPGVPRHFGQLRLQWRGGPWEAALEAWVNGAVNVDDRGTASAPGYGLVHAELARLWHAGEGRLRGFARIDNVFDRQHMGSVIVNEGNGRYYEPGPGRAVLLGLEWQLR